MSPQRESHRLSTTTLDEHQSTKNSQINEAIPSNSAQRVRVSTQQTDRHQTIPMLFLIPHGAPGVEIIAGSLGVPWPNESEDSAETPEHRQRREREGQIGSCFVLLKVMVGRFRFMKISFDGFLVGFELK
jgi:hypothetical protein